MPRSSDAEKVQRLNAAFELLGSGRSHAEAADTLCERFALSRRQAYRYVLNAQQLEARAAPIEVTIPITIKVPARAVDALRAHARISGMTMGEIVSRAITAFLARSKRLG